MPAIINPVLLFFLGIILYNVSFYQLSRFRTEKSSIIVGYISGFVGIVVLCLFEYIIIQDNRSWNDFMGVVSITSGVLFCGLNLFLPGVNSGVDLSPKQKPVVLLTFIVLFCGGIVAVIL